MTNRSPTSACIVLPPRLISVSFHHAPWRAHFTRAEGPRSSDETTSSLTNDKNGQPSQMENLVRSAPDQQTFEVADSAGAHDDHSGPCLLYTSPSPRDRQKSRMPSSA